jgi:hypothetical protein
MVADRQGEETAGMEGQQFRLAFTKARISILETIASLTDFTR